ncbi:DNA replication complex GINS protein PSF3 [Bradysia coprophila]|uniref:DNA replication complex GINS protein PSF3 n=1 Tax=Bradysia coprophila TaxID=38358 RepID=UPI00187D7BD7|nr:DNA replication complex GINS protein PSF3 [Bradysia coprophila]
MQGGSYYPNYFSLEDIIVTQEKVPCIVDANLVGMGCIDPSCETADLTVGKKIELPLWYAMQFDSNSRYRILKVQVPDIFQKLSKDICEADANAVDLGRMNKNFYEFGRYLTRFDHVGHVGPMLVETCRQRSRNLMDLTKGKVNKFKNETKLDNAEKELYIKGSKTNESFSKWLLADGVTIQTADMVSNHRKRKRAAIDL